jgi:hypothetical protein
MLDRLTARPFYRSLLLRQGDGDIPSSLQPADRSEVIADAERLRARWVVVWPEADRGILPYLEAIGYHLIAGDNGALLYGR